MKWGILSSCIALACGVAGCGEVIYVPSDAALAGVEAGDGGAGGSGDGDDGDGGDTQGAAGEPPGGKGADNVAPDVPPARIVTVGRGGFEYQHLHGTVALEGNLPFFVNALSWLAEGRGVMGSHPILITRPCDPRTDPEVCRLTDDADDLQPFYDAVGELGEITYGSTADVSLDDYAVVIVSFCGPHDVDGDVILDYLRGGGRVLVEAQAFCVGTPEKASGLLAPFDLAYTDVDPGEAGILAIPSSERTGFLEGVAAMEVRRWTPQTLGPTSPFAPIIESEDGVLAAYAEIHGNDIAAP